MVAPRGRFLLIAMCVCTCAALDAKWTPNGEAPAPFSTKAREAMGMDPTAFAGQAGNAVVPKGAMLQLTLGALLAMYISNN